VKTPWTSRKAASRAQLESVGASVRDLGDQVRALTQLREQHGGYEALPRPPGWPIVPFGPATPLVPSPINDVRPDGRTDPRLYQYPVSWNLTGTTQRLIPWSLLRDAADRISLFRRCIEIRKGHMGGLGWDIVISQGAVEAAQRAEPDSGRHKVEAAMRDRLGPDIDRAVAFWEVPDPDRGLTFAKWLGMLLEEVFVLDALPIFPRRTYGGDLLGLEIIDGSTIKPLLDERGGRPRPPAPAYQQILYGFPRGEFTADTSLDTAGNHVIDGAYAADRLIYERRVARTWTPYGHSAVEQALDDGDLYLKRRGWMRAEYSDGTSVNDLFTLPEQFGWTPEQLLDYERQYNDQYAGNTQARLGARFLPPGVMPAERSGDGVADRYRPEYDLHLIKLLASHFDTTLPELGFTEAKGLGSEGYHEGQENVQDRKTLALTQEIEGLLTRIGRAHLGLPRELKFTFLGLDDEDNAAADDVARQRVASAGSTINEWRDETGKPRYDFPEADMPMIVTQRGVVFLEGASELAPPGEMVEPMQAPDQQPAPGQDAGEQDDQDDAADAESAAKPGQPDAAKTELAAYRRWARRRRPPGRPFEFTTLTKAAAEHAGVDLDRVTFKAGGAGPKARNGRTWPGWQMDLRSARLHAEELRSAMTGAVQTPALAEAWTSARKAADPAAAHDANAWLAAQGITFVPGLRRALGETYTDGYLIGHLAALAEVSGGPIDWGTWEPGDVEAALAVLGESGAGSGLAAMLDQADITIQSIAANRMSELAQVLADGLLNGDNATTIARAVAELLDDPVWAELVALTETTRAVTRASLDTYARNGVEAVEWLTAEDQRVCQLCAGNEDDGPVLLGQSFGSGDPGPPAHPSCRCALAPASVTDLLEIR
jgi:SPP1 gp7 family putative phage head morphogenesis protein